MGVFSLFVGSLSLFRYFIFLFFLSGTRGTKKEKREKNGFPNPKSFSLMTLFDAAKSVSFRDYIQQQMGLDMTADGRILCPYHTDSKPSFVISKETHHKYPNIGSCFACSKTSVSLIDFVMHFYGLDKADAAKKICDDTKTKYEEKTK